MTNTTDTVERRENERFHLQKRAHVVLRPHYTELGQLEDISMNGLAFRYFAMGEPSNESLELDIYSMDDDSYVKRIPFKTVSDSETGEVCFGCVTTRRYSVQFGKLTDNQISQLEHFIQNHTTAATQV